jgi:cytochrome P450
MAPVRPTERLEDPWAAPLERIDLSQPAIYAANRQWDYFARLRRDAPAHLCAGSPVGPFWSITRFADIMAVDIDHRLFSSASGVQLVDQPADFALPMFIAADPPKHTAQRQDVRPLFTQAAVAALEPTIRAHAAEVLDELPRGEPFDWVDRVSTELSTRMLATLLGFPQQHRRKLARWADVSTYRPGMGVYANEAQRRRELLECAEVFARLRRERTGEPERPDLISVLANAGGANSAEDFLGNVLLLVVAGIDTTRSAMTGALWALSQNPDEYAKLRENRNLVPQLVTEAIRWQTPLAFMRRRATADFAIHGRTIRRGDKVVMWYASGNRDESVIPEADRFWIDRPRTPHLSFGYGVHRCIGKRLAEMQLRVAWEEIMARCPQFQVLGEPERIPLPFVSGYRTLRVELQ